MGEEKKKKKEQREIIRAKVSNVNPFLSVVISLNVIITARYGRNTRKLQVVLLARSFMPRFSYIVASFLCNRHSSYESLILSYERISTEINSREIGDFLRQKVYSKVTRL